TLTDIEVPNDGLFIIGFKATDLGGGQWHYEYALYNMNCDRSAKGFHVPVPSGVTVINIGFHDVDYHSGEPYSPQGWSGSCCSGSMDWDTQAFGANPNANSLRWGTLYNFRFDANAPPKFANASIDLFKPGSPSSVSVQIVAPSICVGDIAPDGVGN